jgi:5'-3' exonuclease
MEADDEIGIQATELSNAGDTPVIVSTDKDLDMIPARHYNWVKQEVYDVTDEEAYRNFFRQCLTGDTVDNVPGIYRVGPERAGAILADYRKPRGMLHATRKAWNDAYPEGVECHDGKRLTADQALIEHGRLLWICRVRNAPLWHPEQVV